MYKNIKFVKSIFDLKSLKESQFPEIILCGRSNVGKSSFINSLFNRKSLAKSSSTPGKTRSINYYLVENKFYLVDLPGYGYAKASQKEIQQWSELLSDYIMKSKNIFHAFHILDSRHIPSELDIRMNKLLKSISISYSFILSKSDKLKISELSRTFSDVSKVFPEAVRDENLFLFSSETGKYRQAVFKRIQSLFSHS